MVTNLSLLHKISPSSSNFSGHATIHSTGSGQSLHGFPVGEYSGNDNYKDSYMQVSGYWGFWELK